MVPNSFLTSHLVLNRDLTLKNITAKMVSHVNYNLDASKATESFINDSLTKHLDITGLFSDLQYGFRALRFTADILTVLSERIYNSLDASGESRAIVLDKVWHTRLLHKLKAYGVVGRILSIWKLFCRNVH